MRGEVQLPKVIQFTFGAVTLKTSVNSVLNAQGDLIGYLVTWNEISEQLRSEKERLEKEQDQAGQLAAIKKSQAVIEFNLNGEILTANQNLLDVLGYRLEEIQGRHHSMFVDDTYR